MKRIFPEFNFSEEQLNIVRSLARECNLCEETVSILYGRGMRDRESINNFMHPSKANFISPFKMSGMREATELIARARDEGWAVLVYGDYDADGICASTIMANSLRDFGIEPYICVPERSNGYGLSIGLIDEIFENCFPQLVITVDCGISCFDEVEYIKELGAEVIVTDHHELPDRIPDCICINPKFSDGYIYDNLCGAGVAFKVGCALNGESAYKYLDFAAIATVADSVPLTGENRDIVYEGLKLINRNPSKCYEQFLNKQDVVTSQSLAFTVAPKINAAGRMGDAKAALELFNERDDKKIFALAAKLTAYNLERQKYCDELYSSAKQMIRERGSAGKIILLYNENWNSGFVGIVAARIAEEFSCPAILFVKNGNMLKGSARSIENVNIFEALKACGKYINEFGGHSQAAGVNVTLDNFENLYNALEEYMSENYTEEDFIPTVYYNGILDREYSAKFVKELELLEPYGVGNRRPMFVLDAKSVPAKQLKPQAQHLTLKCDKIDLMYFGGVKHKKIIESAVPKKFIFEYNVSTFRGKEYIKGFVRDLIYDETAKDFARGEIEITGLDALSRSQARAYGIVSRADADNAMKEGGVGTLFVAWDGSACDKCKNAGGLRTDLFIPASRNFSNVILLAPDKCADLSGFTRIIYLDGSPEYLQIALPDGAKVEVCEDAPVPGYIKKIDCEREKLLEIFSGLSANCANLDGSSAEEAAINNVWEYDKSFVFFALKVFEQLGLLTFKNGKAEIVRGIKTRLENSELYTIVKELQAE